MYLADRDIKALLSEIRFDTDDPAHPFLPDDQVQPCSVDLRLDRTFWRQQSLKPIDLRRSKLLELSPRRHWRKIMLGHGETVTLRPGEMVLGRTFEVFTIPPRYAGKLEGRSSFARMGLGVHCSADFINPGYRGRMPLQLTNFGRSSIKLVSLIPICQLMFVPLSSEPERTYGARELSSKYMDDDGGPSYWWRDKRIKQLHLALGQGDVAERVQVEILELIGPCEPDLIERFERMVRRLPIEALTNSDDLLERFARSEEWVRLLAQARRGIQAGSAPFLLASSLGSLFSQPFGWLHYLLWVLTMCSIPLSVVGFRLDLGDYFGSKELERVRREKEATRSIP